MKKVNFLGVEFNVIDDDDVEDARCRGEEMEYGVIRVSDSDPLGGSPELRARRITVPCDDCGHQCWLDPKSFDQVRKLNPEIVCLRCLNARARQREEHSGE